jgi:hypothetical protein
MNQDEITGILDQANDPKKHEEVFNFNIDNFEMSYEESVSYFRGLENFRCNYGPDTLREDNEKSDTNSVNKSFKITKSSNMWVFVNFDIRTATKTQPITEQSPSSNIRKRIKLTLKPNLVLGISLCLSFFLSKETHVKNLKKNQAARTGPRKSECLLSTEINLNICSNQAEQQQYFLLLLNQLDLSRLT